MNGRIALAIGAVLAALGGAAAAYVISHRDAPPRLSNAPATESTSAFRPPQSQPTGTTLAPPFGPVWSVAKVLRLIDGASVTVDGRRVRIRSATALCSGSGAPLEDGGVRRWQAFDCTYTVFAGGIDRDLEFHVDVLDEERYRLGNFRWLGGR